MAVMFPRANTECVCPACKQKVGVEAVAFPAQIAGWFLSANLQTIGELQTLLAREGFELHIATAPVTVISEER